MEDRLAKYLMSKFPTKGWEGDWKYVKQQRGFRFENRIKMFHRDKRFSGYQAVAVTVLKADWRLTRVSFPDPRHEWYIATNDAFLTELFVTLVDNERETLDALITAAQEGRAC